MTQTEFVKRCDKLQNLLFGFAMKLTQNRENARDLYQETLTRAYANKDRFTMGTNFKAWITTIMRNNFINEYRKRRTRNKVEQPLEENLEFNLKESAQNTAVSSLMCQELQRMLNSIGEGHRVPFLMFFNGYEYKEIAEKLDLPMGTVKSRIFFARRKLKTLILNHYLHL